MRSKILDPEFKYVPAAATDIQVTWRKFGWRPLNEMPDVRSVDTSKENSSEERNSPKIKRVR